MGMNRQKMFLILLFVIGLVYIIGTTLGSTHSDDQSAQTPGWLSNIGAKLVITQQLKLADLNPTPASCLQQGNLVVLAGSTCTFAIQSSTFTQRVATVQMVQGNSALVTLTQEQGMPLQESLTAAHTVTTSDLKIYSGKSHGVLAIQCLKAGGVHACLLKLK